MVAERGHGLQGLRRVPEHLALVASFNPRASLDDIHSHPAEEEVEAQRKGPEGHGHLVGEWLCVNSVRPPGPCEGNQQQ